MPVALRSFVLQPCREADRFIVLAALDGSDGDIEALREGANLARGKRKGELVLHVVSGAWTKAVLILVDELRADLLVNGPARYP